jgi:hypothetical protein
MLHLKLLEKQEQTKPKREIIKIRAKINEIETQKQSTKQKAGSLKK